MQIVNSTERYTNLTTNRLAAVSSNLGQLVADSATVNGDFNSNGNFFADSATVNNVTVTGLIETLDLNANGTLNVNGDFNSNGNFFANGSAQMNGMVRANGGFLTQSAVIQSNYNLTGADSNTHFVLENVTGSPIEARLPPTSSVSGGVYHFTVGDNVTDPIIIKTVGGDVIHGLVLEGTGTSTNFNGANQVTVTPGVAEHGDKFEVRSTPQGTYIGSGIAKNTMAFSP